VEAEGRLLYKSIPNSCLDFRKVAFSDCFGFEIQWVTGI